MNSLIKPDHVNKDLHSRLQKSIENSTAYYNSDNITAAKIELMMAVSALELIDNKILKTKCQHQKQK